MHSVCLSVPELSLAEYVKIGLSSKQKLEIFAVNFDVLHKIQNLVIHVVVSQKTDKKCTKIYSAHAELLCC